MIIFESTKNKRFFFTLALHNGIIAPNLQVFC